MTKGESEAEGDPNGLRLELHCHSGASPDSKATPEDIIARVKELGLHGLALTDHNSVANQRRMARLAEDNGLFFLPAIEVSTRAGHLLGYNIAEPIQKGLSAAKTAEIIHKAGGLAVAAHPFRPGTGLGPRLALALELDGIEILNGHSSPTGNGKAQRLANTFQARRKLITPDRKARPLIHTGGSDAHTADRLGLVSTEFPGLDPASATEDNILTALRKGECWPEGSSSTALALDYQLRVVVNRARRGFRRI